MLTIAAAGDIIAHGSMGGPGRFIFFPIALFFTIAIIGLFIALIVRLSRARGWREGATNTGSGGSAMDGRGYPGPGHPGPHTWAAQPKSPEQILADRLVKGEIDEADYSSRLAALRDGASS